MPFYFPLGKKLDLRGKILILPVVSVANVSQLSADLLISTLGLEQVGVFDARDLVPVVGSRENGLPGITTPLELYGKEGFEIVVIQQRSPVLKARKGTFTNSLLDFVRENQLGGLLLLTGVDLSNRTDSQMQSPVYKLTAHSSATLPNDSLLSQINALPTYSFAPPQHQSFDANAVPAATYRPQSDTPFIPGGGITRRLLSSLSSSWGIPTACILQFVLEGDNRADAEFLAGVVAKILKLETQTKQWCQPRSWSVGLFGTPNDQTLYG